MREKISYLASWIIVIVVFARFAIEIIFLPFVAVPGSKEWNEVFAPILVMIAAAGLSFTQYRFFGVVAAALAFIWTCAQLLSAGWIWAFSPTGFWAIVPTLSLVIATIAKWLAQRSCELASAPRSESD